MKNYIKFLYENYPILVEDMQHSRHNFIDEEDFKYNKYHMEDSVWAHTCMVAKLGELLLDSEDENVKIACLLHDIGKPDTNEFDFEKRKKTFYGHAGVSFWKSIEILNRLIPEFSKEMPSIQREDKIEILSLIALHLDFMNIKDNPTKIKHRFKNNEDLLRRLAKLYYCDSNGRFAEDEYATRAEIIKLGNTTVLEDKIGIDNNDPTLTLLCGLPCSGKSTYVNDSNILIKEKNIIISRDDILMNEAGTTDYQKAWSTVDHEKVNLILEETFIKAVHERKNIIIDMTNMSRKSRNKFTCRVPNIYNKKCVIFATGLDVIEERNIRRNQQVKKFIPKEVFLNMQKSFTLPMYDEFDIIDWRF